MGIIVLNYWFNCDEDNYLGMYFGVESCFPLPDNPNHDQLCIICMNVMLIYKYKCCEMLINVFVC